MTNLSESRFKIRAPARFATALVAVLGLASCVSEQHNAKGSATPAQSSITHASITEVPIDYRLSLALGVTMRALEVHYPSSMKLCVTRRIYTNGVLDTVNSARQIEGTTLPVGEVDLSLGWLDPDALSPGHQGKIKVFGSVGPYWIDKPSERNVGGSIAVPTSGDFPAGTNVLAMEFAYGVPAYSSGGIMSSDFRGHPTIRVTLHVLVEPLSEKERALLKKYPNFSEAFKVDE